MADNNNFEEIGPKDELIDAIAQLDDEGDRIIELKDEETGEVTKAVVESTFLFNGSTYVVLIVDTDEKDEDGELISAYVIMRFVDKDGEAAKVLRCAYLHDVVLESRKATERGHLLEQRLYVIVGKAALGVALDGIVEYQSYLVILLLSK